MHRLLLNPASLLHVLACLLACLRACVPLPLPLPSVTHHLSVFACNAGFRQVLRYRLASHPAISNHFGAPTAAHARLGRARRARCETNGSVILWLRAGLYWFKGNQKRSLFACSASTPRFCGLGFLPCRSSGIRIHRQPQEFLPASGQDPDGVICTYSVCLIFLVLATISMDGALLEPDHGWTDGCNDLDKQMLHNGRLFKLRNSWCAAYYDVSKLVNMRH